MSVAGARRELLDPVASARDGFIGLFLGNEAVVRGALEAGVGFASGYPGTPSSEITDAFARIAAAGEVLFEQSVNEKVALEVAFAASLAGVRSICAMKHLGLMAAADPLSTIPYVGVGAGMVIVSAGDPSCHTSPNEQDQRFLGPMLHLPVLDPEDPQAACDLTRGAFLLSEESRLPVLLRITTRVAHGRGPVRCGPMAPRRAAEFVRDPRRLVPVPANARRLRLELPERLRTARRASERLYLESGTGTRAIVAAGGPASLCRQILEDAEVEDVVLARLPAVHPLPEAALLHLLQRCESVLVVEELSPFLEDALAALCARERLPVRILGKRSKHLPEPFEYDPDTLRRALHAAFGIGSVPAPPETVEELPPRPPILCAECPHRAIYFAARAAFPDDQLYFNDIGCYTLGYGAPLDTADALLCMGAGFTLAAGVARVTGRRTVGFMGDSTFFHSGMPALLDAIKEDADLVAVILDNQVTAMTGFQESPTVHREAGSDGLLPRTTSIEEVVRALGARHVERVDSADVPAAIAAFQRARAARGVSVVVATHPCPVLMARLGNPARDVVYRVDHARCQSCGRAGCGLRCTQGVTIGLERHMARSRVLQDHDAPRGVAAQPPVAPCAAACPLGLCVQGYAGHVAAGQYREALELIMSRCPLPDSVCRVCHRPCESVCTRAGIDGSVAINGLKRFVMDWAAAQTEPPYVPPRAEGNGLSVAVVGAGPAGLAAAHDLALRGYRVTLLDRAEEPGGLLASGIPAFRLPPEALARDVARILALGVTFEGGIELGVHVTLRELLPGGARGHDAVFLALGAASPAVLSLGSDVRGAPVVIDALAYLSAARSAARPSTGRRVVVVGGGNAAVDAARTARRFGAESVTVAYRRGREQMRAIPGEVEEALAEGVRLATELVPVELCAGGIVFRHAGRGVQMLEADQVIVAVGQAPDTAYLSGASCRLSVGRGLVPRRMPAGDKPPPYEDSDDGQLVVDAETCETSHPRVFAGGDLAPGGRTVTEAIAWGQRAAWGIDAALRGKEVADRMPPRPLPAPGAWARPSPPPPVTAPSRGARPPELPPSRRGSFDEVVGTLSEAEARAEGARCESCGTCGNCRACIDLFGCPAFYLTDGRVAIDAASCTGCGVCAAFCPNGAIVPSPRSLDA